MHKDDHDEKEFERIVQNLNIELPEGYEERFNSMIEEETTGIIDSKNHWMVMTMDHDPETSTQKWRFISRFDRETSLYLLRRLLDEWTE